MIKDNNNLLLKTNHKDKIIINKNNKSKNNIKKNHIIRFNYWNKMIRNNGIRLNYHHHCLILSVVIMMIMKLLVVIMMIMKLLVVIMMIMKINKLV